MHRMVVGHPQRRIREFAERLRKGCSAADRGSARLHIAYWLPLPAGGIASVLFRLRYDGLRSSRTEYASSPIPADGDGAIVTSSNVKSGR
jgi:hypothetical protein